MGIHKLHAGGLGVFDMPNSDRYEILQYCQLSIYRTPSSGLANHHTFPHLFGGETLPNLLILCSPYSITITSCSKSLKWCISRLRDDTVFTKRYTAIVDKAIALSTIPNITVILELVEIAKDED